VGFTIGPTNTGDMIIRGAYGSFEQNAFTNPPFVTTVALSGGVRLSNPGQGVTAATSGVWTTQATSTDFENPRTTWGAESQFTWSQVPMIGSLHALPSPSLPVASARTPIRATAPMPSSYSAAPVRGNLDWESATTGWRTWC